MQFIFLLLFASFLFHISAGQEIALTFDDAPMWDSPLFTNAERTEKIAAQLRKHGVKEATFFVITGNIDRENVKQLNTYTQDGHLLANHSHSHLSPARVRSNVYLNDITKADSILRDLKNVMNWYRYPFLNEGTSVSYRDSIRNHLKKLSLVNGYVTVDNYDWFINGELIKAAKAGKTIHYDRLKKVYISHVIESIEFYDNVAKSSLGRSPKHVLLLHENDLAALFLSDLLLALGKKGWKIISSKDAYQDPIALETPDVLFNGQGRVAAIAYSKGVKAVNLVQQSEDENYLLKLLTDFKVFE